VGWQKGPDGDSDLGGKNKEETHFAIGKEPICRIFAFVHDDLES